jgi:hypothetical protein
MDRAAQGARTVTSLAAYLIESGPYRRAEIGKCASPHFESLLAWTKRKFGADQDG